MNPRKLLDQAKSYINKLKTGTPIPVTNYFHTNFDKNALLSYITEPFTTGISYTHTNFQRNILIAQALRDLGYNVDVIKGSDTSKIDYAKYSLIFGYGAPLSNSIVANSRATKIYFGAGIHPYIGHFRSAQRVHEAFLDTGVMMPESGRLETISGVECSLPDGIITFGGNQVKETYATFFKGPIQLAPLIYYRVYEPAEIIEKKNWQSAQKQFLFISGPGLIRKGLDLVLKVFKNHPELQLHICAKFDAEKRFQQVYAPYLNLPNVHVHGYIDIQSEEYRQLLVDCAFIINATVADACPSALTTPIGSSGIIPVITPENGFEPFPFAIEIACATEDAIEKAIVQTQRLSEKELITRSQAGYTFFESHYSDEQFLKGLTECVQAVIAHPYNSIHS